MSRQTIITALAAQLATITTANHYATEAGSNVFVWRKYPVAPADCPCLVVSDTDLAREYVTNEFRAYVGMVRNSLTVEIVAITSGAVTDVEARSMEKDIITCIHANESLGGIVESIEVTASSLVLEQYETVVGAVKVTAAIVYSTERGAC